jgi:eukaryotic-like serine/threonine-protein kinase
MKETVMADRVGQQLGNYRLIRLLGQGGFAEVYLGEHIYLNTLAAIKVLYARLASEDVDHFLAEARTIARLVHPHIVRVLEFDVKDSIPYLVVDYASNGTLRKRHPRGVPLPLATVVNYVMQAADALEYAHEQKVIHRDVKPENMLLGRRNELLLSDFGIALVAQSSRSNSTQGIQDLAGTIAYMAPEQIQSKAVPNSDQYSLAVVVYEWLSGVRPFQGSFPEIAVKHTMVSPPPLSERVPTLPLAVEEVIMKALAKDPQQRFDTVQAFADALKQAAGQELQSPSAMTGTSASEDQASGAASTIVLADIESPSESLVTVPSMSSPLPATMSLLNETSELEVETPETKRSERTPLALPEQRRGISRRNVVLGLVAVAAAGALGGGLALFAHQQKSSTPPLNQATSRYTYSGHTNWVWSAAWSPHDGRIASASSDATARVWDALNGNHLNIYSGHKDSVYTVAWSPDGTRIASASFDKTVQVWNPTFGDHYYTYKGHTNWVWSVAWSPDGRRIASAGGDKTVQIWDATDGSHRIIYRGHTDHVFAVAWSPDGTRIASAGGDGTVQVWDPATGELFYKFQLYFTSMWSIAWSPDGQRIVSASNDKTVQIWNAANGGQLFIYTGHRDFVYGVAWSPDGKHIASASGDKTVQVWNATDGSHVYTYTGHTASVRSVSWSPDSKLLASGSWDKTVQVWRVQ